MNSKVNINNIASWPPGTWMLYDDRRFDISGVNKRFGISNHVGLGLVVANDGVNLIHVIWDSSSHMRLRAYDVGMLNPDVIFHVG